MSSPAALPTTTAELGSAGPWASAPAAGDADAHKFTQVLRCLEEMRTDSAASSEKASSPDTIPPNNGGGAVGGLGTNAFGGGSIWGDATGDAPTGEAFPGWNMLSPPKPDTEAPTAIPKPAQDWELDFDKIINDVTTETTSPVAQSKAKAAKPPRPEKEKSGGKKPNVNATPFVPSAGATPFVPKSAEVSDAPAPASDVATPAEALAAATPTAGQPVAGVTPTALSPQQMEMFLYQQQLMMQAMMVGHMIQGTAPNPAAMLPGTPNQALGVGGGLGTPQAPGSAATTPTFVPPMMPAALQMASPMMWPPGGMPPMSPFTVQAGPAGGVVPTPTMQSAPKGEHAEGLVPPPDAADPTKPLPDWVVADPGPFLVAGEGKDAERTTPEEDAKVDEDPTDDKPSSGGPPGKNVNAPSFTPAGGWGLKNPPGAWFSNPLNCYLKTHTAPSPLAPPTQREGTSAIATPTDHPDVNLHMFLYQYCDPERLHVGKQTARSADMKLGGLNSDVPPWCVVHLLESLSGIQIQAIDMFRFNHGMCTLWLKDPTRVNELIACVHRAIWMAPYAKDSGGYAVAVNDETSQSFLQTYLEGLRKSGPKKVRFPRHLITAEVWKDAPSNATHNGAT